jgi:ABC-type oligopeptide transport system substrate-binding subunit
MSKDSKENTSILRLILNVISQIFGLLSSSKKKKKQEEKKRMQAVHAGLEDHYNEIEEKKKKKQRETQDVEDISDRLNRRF